ncbi:MAG: OsmC family protein [Salinivenus sp.]
MQATSEHTHGDFQSVVDNGRQHGLVLDLPPGQDGEDLGPTALELTGMSLAGCISTIWAKVAENSGVSYRKIEVEMTLEKGDTTISDSEALVRVDSNEDLDKLERILEKTMHVCPVGHLFEQAGVDTDTTLVKESLMTDGPK